MLLGLFQTTMKFNLMMSNKENCKILHLEGNNPRDQYMLGSTQLESSLPEKNLGIKTPSWTWVRNVPLLLRRLAVFLFALSKVLTASQERWSFPSSQHWWGSRWGTASSSELFSTRQTWTYWKESNKAPLWSLKDQSISSIRKDWESWDSSD